MGSNLPPGVTTNMIPGNRPEDTAWERLRDALEEASVHELRTKLSDERAKVLDGWLDDLANDELDDLRDSERYDGPYGGDGPDD